MHQRMRERILAHRTGKCGEQRCRDIVADELDLGLPKDTEQRQAWYDMQKEMWQPWRTAMDQHQWSFQSGKCNHCSLSGLQLEAAGMMICLQQCYRTAPPNYPTGHLQPYLADLIQHLKKCTSHSSLMTSKHMDYLGTIYGSLAHREKEGWSRSTFSYKNQRPQNKNSYSDMPLRASASRRQKPPAFSIPKN